MLHHAEGRNLAKPTGLARETIPPSPPVFFFTCVSDFFGVCLGAALNW